MFQLYPPYSSEYKKTYSNSLYTDSKAWFIAKNLYN